MEVMIVIALLVLMITLIGVHTHFMQITVIRSELETLQATCYHLQATALATNAPQALMLDGQRHQYMYHNHVHQLSAPVQFGILPGVKGPPSAPNQLLATAITFINQTILFYPDGTIQAGTVYLTDAKRNLYALSSAVSSVSFLRKYRYDGAWHLIE